MSGRSHAESALREARAITLPPPPIADRPGQLGPASGSLVPSAVRAGAVVALVGAGLGLVGAFLPLYLDQSIRWLDLSNDSLHHATAIGSILRGLVPPGVVGGSAIAMLAVWLPIRRTTYFLFGASLVWCVWMVSAWADSTRYLKAGPGLYAVVLGSVCAVAGGALAVRGWRRQDNSPTAGYI